MRERDMRLRVERFLQSRLRSMLLPATMGLGLAVGACASDGLNTDDGGDKEDVVATDTAVTKYMAPTTDAAPIPVPVYSVAVPKEDAGMVLRYMAQMPDAGRDAGEMVALYLAQIPDPQT